MVCVLSGVCTGVVTYCICSFLKKITFVVTGKKENDDDPETFIFVVFMQVIPTLLVATITIIEMVKRFIIAA